MSYELADKAIEVAEAALAERERRSESKAGKLVEGTYDAAIQKLDIALDEYKAIRIAPEA